MSYFSVFLLVVTGLGPVVTNSHYSVNRFVSVPEGILYAEERGNVTATWEFQIETRVKSRTRIEDFIFGEWGPPGYVKYKILYLDSNYKVKPRPGYEDKVRYEVNVSHLIVNCSAQITILKLTPMDFKSYGIDILVGLDQSPLINTFELRDPPKIVEFSSSELIVTRGNKTAFECRAKGIPEPLVIIKREDKILCNATSYCHWAIHNVTAKDEGEYECIAQQGERSDERSKKLTVLGKDDGKSARGSSTLIIAIVVPVAVVVVVVLLGCLMWFYRGTWKKSYHFDKDEGKAFKI